MSDEGEYERVDAGAAQTFPAQASAIKKGGYVVLKGRPCRVVDTSTSKTGKHGSAKCHITAIDIFTNKKIEEISPSTHTMQVPNISRKEYTLVDVSSDGYVSLMAEDGKLSCFFHFSPWPLFGSIIIKQLIIPFQSSGNVKEDLKVPDDDEIVSSKIREGFEANKEILVSVLSAMGEEKIVAAKESSQ